MAWFTGTSTGDRYTVGQSYANGNGTYVAQADGTFKNVNSGRTEVGSSQDPRTVWGGSSVVSSGGGDYAHSGGGSGPGSASVVSGGERSGSGPGNGMSVSGGGSGRIGAGSGSALVLAFPPQQKGSSVTHLVVGGKDVKHDEGWSDAGDGEQRWGEGELFSPTWFYQWGVAGADMWKNLEGALPQRTVPITESMPRMSRPASGPEPIRTRNRDR